MVSVDGSTTAYRCSNTVFTAGTWYLVTGVYDASAQTLHMYVNGVLDDGALTGTVPTSLYNTSQNFAIGRKGNGGYFNGYIDDARVYNRAITATEILNLYKSTGLIGRWKMDEGSGSTAADSSGHGYTGTLTLGPTWTTGNINGAVNFDGANDYIDMSDINTLDGVTALTVSAWVKSRVSGANNT